MTPVPSFPDYQDAEIVNNNPFACLDQTGVGQLVEMGVDRGRAAKPGLEGRDLRGARRRSLFGEILSPHRVELRELFPVPDSDRQVGGCTGCPGRSPSPKESDPEILIAI